MASETRLIAFDWGTTFLRVFRLGAGGAVLDKRQLQLGVMRIQGDSYRRTIEFERAFEQACADWLAASPGAAVIACGMVGSAQGWRDAGYLEVPQTLDELGASLKIVKTSAGIVLHIVPGLLQRGELPDVIRGEETQLVGALESLPASAGPSLVGLPGTHGKWVELNGRRILGFHTFMTGEVYQALCEHTILGRTLRRLQVLNTGAFDRGVEVARSALGRAGLLSNIFSARSLGLVESLSGEEQAEYLSGLLVGHELYGLQQIRPGILEQVERLLLVGAPELCQRYRRALAAFGRTDVTESTQAAERGLWRIAVTAGLVKAE